MQVISETPTAYYTDLMQVIQPRAYYSDLMQVIQPKAYYSDLMQVIQPRAYYSDLMQVISETPRAYYSDLMQVISETPRANYNIRYLEFYYIKNMETAFGNANLKHFDILQIMTQCETHLEI